MRNMVSTQEGGCFVVSRSLCATCGILVPWPGIDSGRKKHQVLTNGQLGSSGFSFLNHPFPGPQKVNKIYIFLTFSVQSYFLFVINLFLFGIIIPPVLVYVSVQFSSVAQSCPTL